jgi:hypothetical protein
MDVTYPDRPEKLKVDVFHVAIPPYAAAASDVRSEENVTSHNDPRGGYSPCTKTYVYITMSPSAFTSALPLLQEARLRRASKPETAVILSADVDRGLHLGRQFVQQDEAAAFEPIRSGPFQPVRWHLHVLAPPPWPNADWRSQPSTQWPPNDYAYRHPIESWVIEEFTAAPFPN